MPSMFLLPLMLLQSSFDPGGITSPYASALPREIVEKKEDEARKRAEQEAAEAPAIAPILPGFDDGGEQGAHSSCLAAVAGDPEGAAAAARAALGRAQGRERVRAGYCLGLALSEADHWTEAQEAFSAALQATAPEDHATRARLGAMAGNAALAAGKPGDALTALESADAEAWKAGDGAQQASIAIDRARAQVGLGQLDAAASTLAAARTAQPDNAQVWLLSATLARRQDKLAEAQTEIEKAAQLTPGDPEVGLEAGVIAILSGHRDAARLSWQSVVKTSPKSPSAATARDYLAQLSEMPEGNDPVPVAKR